MVDFLVNEYILNVCESIGYSDLLNGKVWYEY